MLLSLLFLTALGAASPAKCTIIVRPWVRGDSMAYIVAAAGADTALAAHWSPPDFHFPREGAPPAPSRAALPSQPVYGQRARVERASGVTTGRAALLIFWGLGSMCNREPRAGSARALPPGTRFFLAGMPRADSLAPAGLPTFDVMTGITLYAPELERRRPPRSWRTLWQAPRVLNLSEYEELYRLLPTRTAWEADPVRAAESLRAWARAHRRLARVAPAKALLEGMEDEMQHIMRVSRPARTELLEARDWY